MSLKLRVQSDTKLVQLNVSPTTFMYDIIVEACNKIEPSYDPLNFYLIFQKKEIDLSLTFKGSNIPSNSIVELKYRVLQKNQTIKVALQPPTGSRLTESFPILTSLWSILTFWEEKEKVNFTKLKGANPSNKEEGYMQPVIQLNNAEFSSNQKLATTTLASLGLRSGSISIRLTFRFDQDLTLLQFTPSQSNNSNNTENTNNSNNHNNSNNINSNNNTLNNSNSNNTLNNSSNNLEEQKKKEEWEKQKQIEEEKQKQIQIETQKQLEEEKQKKLQQMKEEEEKQKRRQKEKLQQLEEQRKREEERKKLLQQQQLLDQQKLQLYEKQKQLEHQQHLQKSKEEKERQQLLLQQNLSHSKSNSSSLNSSNPSNSSSLQLNDTPLKIEEKREGNQNKVEGVERNRYVFAPSDKLQTVNDIVLGKDFEEEEEVSVNEKEFKEFSSIAPGENWLFKGKENEIMTKNKREEIRSKTYQKYKKTNIRVRFPDRYELQGTFDKNETSKDLYQFVKENICDPQKSFYLYTTPPKINLPLNDSFFKQRLVPAAIVYFSFTDTTETNPQYLKPEILSNVQPSSLNLVSTFEKLSTEDQLKDYKSSYLSNFETYNEDEEGKQTIKENTEKKEKKGTVDLFSKLRNKK